MLFLRNEFFPHCEFIGLESQSTGMQFDFPLLTPYTIQPHQEAQIQQIVVAAKRYNGVLTEGLRHELQLVAEGFQIHLDRRHADDRACLDEQFRETCALIQLSYRHLGLTA